MLAIIIPFYKITYFEATLQSLANQTDNRFKVYIGDDASPNDSSPLLKKFEGKFDFLYHRFEDNLGGKSLTLQWKRCIELKGDEEWLMILGDDDMLESNVVQTFHDHYCYFNSKSKKNKSISLRFQNWHKMMLTIRIETDILFYKHFVVTEFVFK